MYINILNKSGAKNLPIVTLVKSKSGEHCSTAFRIESVVLSSGAFSA